MYTERQKYCTTFSFDFFFWIKIDDFKNKCALVFMPGQKTIIIEKIKCVGNHTYILIMPTFLGEKCKIVTFGHKISPENVFIETTDLML